MIRHILPQRCQRKQWIDQEAGLPSSFPPLASPSGPAGPEAKSAHTRIDTHARTHVRTDSLTDLEGPKGNDTNGVEGRGPAAHIAG